MGDLNLQTIVGDALRRAYSLGQTYWQQADSEYVSQHKKADATAAKFSKLVDDIVAQVAAAHPPAQVPAPGELMPEQVEAAFGAYAADICPSSRMDIARAILASSAPGGGEPSGRGLSAPQIEAIFKASGGQWDGDRWVIEDADLHPFAKAVAAAHPQGQDGGVTK